MKEKLIKESWKDKGGQNNPPISPRPNVTPGGRIQINQDNSIDLTKFLGLVKKCFETRHIICFYPTGRFGEDECGHCPACQLAEIIKKY